MAWLTFNERAMWAAEAIRKGRAQIASEPVEVAAKLAELNFPPPNMATLETWRFHKVAALPLLVKDGETAAEALARVRQGN